MKKTWIVLGLVVMCACGGRIPSPQKAHHLTQNHFQKYGKKYKATDFGTHRLEKVEIIDVREIQKKLAEVEADAYFSEGLKYKVRLIVQRKSFGWKLASWEILEGPQK